MTSIFRPAFLIAVGTVILGAITVPAEAQSPTVHIQGALLGEVAGTVTLGLQLNRSIGDPGLPKPGQIIEDDSRPWLLTLGAAAGVSVARKHGRDDGFTATGHAGLMRRTGKTVDQIGVVAYLNTKPFGAGPAVRAKVAILDVQAGGLWLEDGLGFRWFVGGGISLQFLLDVFKR